MRLNLVLLSSQSLQSPTALKYANDLVRKLDSDSFFPSLFYSSDSRPTYLAIKALNVELTSINENVSNPGVGRMRFQWWRDIIQNGFDSKPPISHPFSHLLSALPLKSLSPYHFTRLINAREQHFLNPTFSSLQDLSDYSAGTQASILYLLLQSMVSVDRSTSLRSPEVSPMELLHAVPFNHVGDEHLVATSTSTSTSTSDAILPITPLLLDHAVSHLAVAITIAILLRSIPHHASRRISVIPIEIASRYNLSEEILFRSGPDTPNLLECVSTLVGIAEAELRTARACFNQTGGIPDKVMPIFLSAVPARSFLERLASKEIGYNVFDGRMQKRYWKLPFQIWSDFRSKRF